MTTLLRASALALIVSYGSRAALGGGAPALKGTVVLTVKETAGLRRFGYPVSGRVALPAGASSEVLNLRLVDDKGAGVPAQFTIASRHKDSSVDLVDVDFNTSILPRATATFSLEYGPDAQPVPARGLSVQETDEAYTVGAYRIPKSGLDVISAIRYGNNSYLLDERGLQLGVATKDNRYLSFREAQITARRVEKAGPLSVVIAFDGKYEALTDPQAITFTTRLEFVNSKSWVKVTHALRDPLKMVDEITLSMPFALTGPLNWDLGAGSWLYGTLNADERVTFTQTILSGDADNPTRARWQATTRRGETTTPYASSDPEPLRQYAEGWGHLSDASKVIAIGFDQFKEYFGQRTLEFFGDGSAFFRYRPTPDLRPKSPNFFGRVKVPVHELSVYFHFVGVPVQKTAVTSPPSMLAPLQVTWKSAKK